MRSPECDPSPSFEHEVGTRRWPAGPVLHIRADPTLRRAMLTQHHADTVGVPGSLWPTCFLEQKRTDYVARYRFYPLFRVDPQSPWVAC